jgi:peptide/nickel transport system ATP-binding protein
MKSEKQRVKGETLLEIRGLKIEGNSDGVWHPIVKGVDLSLKRGEVLGLIGESGAGKSTIGLAAMGFARPGCRIIDGTIMFDGIDLRAASEEERRGSGARASPMWRRVRPPPSTRPTS